MADSFLETKSGRRLDSVAKHLPTLDDAPDTMQKLIADLGLSENVKELHEQGYTIVKGALSPELALRVREKTLAAEMEAPEAAAMAAAAHQAWHWLTHRFAF